MPDGYLINKQALEVASGLRGLYQLIDAASAADNGVWVDFSEFKTGSIDITGTFTGLSAQLMGSNAALIPLNSADGNPIGSAITAAGLVALTTPVRWLKLKITAITTGSVSANLFALS